MKGLDQFKLDLYLNLRRTELLDRLEKLLSEEETARIRGALAELKEMKTLTDAITRSLSSL